jgi:hypothetical protein
MNMSKRVTDVFSDTDLLLGVITILVIYLGLAFVYCLIVPDRLLSVLLLIVEGFYAARAIRNTGMFLLREPVNPWYARSYSLVFLVVFGFLLNVFVMAVDFTVADIVPVSDSIPFWARVLAIMPIEFAWVILPDWRSGDPPSGDGSDWTYIPRNPHFRN